MSAFELSQRGSTWTCHFGVIDRVVSNYQAAAILKFPVPLCWVTGFIIIKIAKAESKARRVLGKSYVHSVLIPNLSGNSTNLSNHGIDTVVDELRLYSSTQPQNLLGAHGTAKQRPTTKWSHFGSR